MALIDTREEALGGGWAIHAVWTVIRLSIGNSASQTVSVLMSDVPENILGLDLLKGSLSRPHWENSLVEYGV